MRIVSVAPYMPFSGIPHAGGEFYRRHAELVAQSHDLVVVAPRNAENEAALAQDADVPYRRLLVAPQATGGRLRSAGHFVLSRTIPFLAVQPFWRALVADPEVLSALRQADRIELQWFNALALAPRLRRRLPRTHQVGVFHDVVSQGVRRMVRTAQVAPRWRLVALAQLIPAVPLERRLLRVLDIAVVVSDKDRALLERRGGRARIVVVAPPLDDADMPTSPETRHGDPPEVLFVGALDRVENQDAVRWLLDRIWPRVTAEVPDARLTIAGAEPGPLLRRVVDSVANVQLTGYVDSLSPYYQQASVVVAPMRLGAGVKLKSVVAMLWGLPVVATSVAAEGVTGPRVFYAVEDDAEDFADAVVAVLKDPSSADGVRDRAFVWSHDTYSTAQYRRSVEQLYPSGAPSDEGGGPAVTEAS